VTENPATGPTGEAADGLASAPGYQPTQVAHPVQGTNPAAEQVQATQPLTQAPGAGDGQPPPGWPASQEPVAAKMEAPAPQPVPPGPMTAQVPFPHACQPHPPLPDRQPAAPQEPAPQEPAQQQPAQQPPAQPYLQQPLAPPAWPSQPTVGYPPPAPVPPGYPQPMPQAYHYPGPVPPGSQGYLPGPVPPAQLYGAPVPAPPMPAAPGYPAPMHPGAVHPAAVYPAPMYPAPVHPAHAGYMQLQPPGYPQAPGMPPSAEMPRAYFAGPPSMLAAAADRERAVDVCKASYGEGRLTKDEFDSRVNQIQASRTYGDLAAVISDLPAGPLGGVSHYQAGGYPVPSGRNYPVAPASTNGLAIGSLVTALLGVPLLPVIMGHIARRQIREGYQSGDGLAIAGLIIGWMGMAFYTLMIIAAIASAGGGGN
jgi:hypothetical protein